MTLLLTSCVVDPNTSMFASTKGVTIMTAATAITTTAASAAAAAGAGTVSSTASSLNSGAVLAAIALMVGGCAALYHHRSRQARARAEQKGEATGLEGSTVLVFVLGAAGAFVLSHIILGRIGAQDEHAAALKNVEVGEPDF